MVPLEPVWHAVLRKYHELGGVGLSGNMLCHLTQMDWPEMKEQIKAYQEDVWETGKKGGRKMLFRGTGLYSAWCHTERARLLIWWAVKPVGYPLNYDSIEQQLTEYPWRDYPSYRASQGQIRVNCYKGEGTYRALQDVVRSYGIEPGDAPYGLAP